MESKVIFFDDVYEHEKKGIDLLRDAIPPKRFYLLVSTKVTNRYSTREIDITLVCPKGIFSIEIKDWSKTIRERISLNNSHLTYIARSGESRKEVNPFSKAEEQRKKVAGFIKKNIHGNQELIRKVNRNGGVKGVCLLYTSLLGQSRKSISDVEDLAGGTALLFFFDARST